MLATEFLPDVNTDAALEGTAGHEMSQICLTNNQDAIEWIDRTINGYLVDDDWAEAIQEYLDECRKYMGEGWKWWIEEQISLEPLGLPTRIINGKRVPVPMYGTADFIAYNEITGELVVIDLKFGVGIAVDAVGNPQPRYYALGAVLMLGDTALITSVKVVIVQPRIPWGKHVKHETLEVSELMEWSVELMAHAQAVFEPEAPFQAGDHCSPFCKRRGNCKPHAEFAMAAALDTAAGEFDFEDPEGKKIAFIDPTLLTVSQIKWVLDNKQVFKGWVNGVEEMAASGIYRGALVIPGWKTAPKRRTLKYKVADEKLIANTILRLAGDANADAIWKKKLATPAQARDLIAKTFRQLGFAADAAKNLAMDALSELTSNESSGFNLVPIAEDRPELLAGSDFELEDEA